MTRDLSGRSLLLHHRFPTLNMTDMNTFTTDSTQTVDQGQQCQLVTVGVGSVPILSWFQNRKKRKRLKRQAEMCKVVREAVKSSQAITTDAIVKKAAAYHETHSHVQEKLDANERVNKRLKHNIHQLEQKVLRLEQALFSASEHQLLLQRAQKEVETQTDEAFSNASYWEFMYPQMPTADLESMQTKVMSLEFTVFRQRKLMELMEETLKAYEPSFSLNTEYGKSM